MDGMADYIRTPSRMFPDMTELEASGFLMNSEKARSLGFHHPHHPQHSFGSVYPRLPALPLASIQQHLLSSMQQRSNLGTAVPSGSGSNAYPPALPFPHHLLSQWSSLAAGFGLNQLGLFGLGMLPPAPPNPPSESSPSGITSDSLVTKSGSPSHQRFSPYPASKTSVSNLDEDSSPSVGNPTAASSPAPALQQA